MSGAYTRKAPGKELFWGVPAWVQDLGFTVQGLKGLIGVPTSVLRSAGFRVMDLRSGAPEHKP